MAPIETPVPAVAFIGRSGSGKTVLTEKIIAELTARGRRVGSVKHHGHKGFDIDIPGKDSWRHTQAGSVHAVVASPDKVAHIRQLEHELELPEILETMTDVEVAIVEGYRQAGAPSIEIFRAGCEKDAERSKRDDILDSEATIGVVTDIPVVAEKARALNLPLFGLEDVADICDFIEAEIIR
ncbi:MAG: molybdopterin-guanine dinucleotide biosynthesis protein B [Coriobacteriales bacterium]